MKRGVFLDRDGVLNKVTLRKGLPMGPGRPEEFELLPGVEGACVKLRAAGFALVVTTNQPDVKRGWLTVSAAESMHARLKHLVDEVRSCYHDDADRCTCRKPLPGMLTEAAARLGIDLEKSWMVGDRWRDVEAGRAAGCRTILVGSGYGETFPNPPDHTVGSLAEAVPIILK